MSARHDHPHAPANFNRAFAIGITLNLGFVLIEAFYGWKVNSLALLADAGHNLSDVAGLVLAWGGTLAVKLRPNARHTYGWKRATILAAFANALLLLMAMGALGWEAVGRLLSPEPLAEAQGVTIMLVAAIGIVINTATALLFMRGGERDLNIRGAFLHMAADALVSAGVVMAGALTLWMGWVWLDPVVSLAIAAVILWGTWSLLRESLQLAMGAVPAHLELADIHAFLAEQPGVTGLHDLHVWGMSTTDTALTAHLVMPEGYPPSGFLDQLSERVFQRFGIQHCTFQIELAHREDHCALLDPARQTKPDFHGHSHGHAHSHTDNHSDKRLSNHSDKHLANHSDKHLDNHLASQSHPHSHTDPRPHPHANDHQDHTH